MPGGRLLFIIPRNMQRKLKILFLEDVADDAGLVERVLRREGWSFVHTRVDTRDAFITALEEFVPDVILSDHGLPQFNSIEALRLCREYGLSVPFILVTGTVSEEFAVTCLKQGADDYVLKSNLSRLPNAITNALNQREAEALKRITEEELRRQNIEISKTNQQLIKTNTELDNFVYSVSHNLRAPLASVLGLINVAKAEEGGVPQQFGTFLEMMEKSVLKLDETLREILDYSRNARGEVQIEKIGIKQLLDESFENLKFLPKAERLKINFVQKGTPECYSDRYRLKIIFHNIISNAIKYSDQLKSENVLNVDVSVNGNIHIVFEDNGIGIRDNYLPNIFDMFYRATEESEGAGLGLYIVREAVERLKGEISVNSKLGNGSLFTITLPNALPTP
jgi:signal transduction histidine kinase